ncbi:MAG: type VI secretion system tube protein Hcp [Pseudomonadota bacterium]
MAKDTYMWFKEGGDITPEGESTDSTYSAEKAFQPLAWSFGCFNPVTIGSGTEGLGTDAVHFQEITITKLLDNASGRLAQCCASGRHIGSAHIACRRAGGDDSVTGTEYLHIDFANCMISSYSLNGGDGFPTETFTMAFGAVDFAYHMQASDTGEQPEPSVMQWNQLTNEASFPA